MPSRISSIVFASALLGLCTGCDNSSSYNTAGPAQGGELAPPQHLPIEFLPNAYRVHSQVICGGTPLGELGFAALKRLGVKTLVSVDADLPDIATAKQYGLRYVHLPHGYEGVSTAQAQQLAKAVLELPGPLYIHCHHGKHRSPTAAAVACVSAGLLPPKNAVVILRTAGTGEQYRGLYQSALSARRFERSLLAELTANFPETAPIPALTEAMVMMERRMAKLQSSRGFSLEHEALLLREQYTELLRNEAVLKQPTAFQQLVREGETVCGELEKAFNRRAAHGATAKQSTVSNAILERLKENCNNCHRQFRDVPLHVAE